MIIEGILIVFGFLLAISGICELIHAIRLLCIKGTKKSGIVSVVFLKNETAVSQLGFAVEQKIWLGDDFAEHVVAVTDRVKPDVLKECRLFAEKHAVILCESGQLDRIVKNIVC